MSVPLVPLGEFQPGDIVTGKIVALEPTGALVDFDIDQLVNVPLSELSLCNIQSPDEALRVDEVREFLVVGNYDGHCERFSLIADLRHLLAAIACLRQQGSWFLFNVVIL